MSTILIEWLTFFLRRILQMTQQGSKAGQMAVISLMTAILCVLAPLSVTLPTSPVPLSMANLVICFTVIILGMKRGVLSVLLYLLLGLAGLPVFSGFTSGIGKLLGPTGGYILGYLLLALILGFFAEHFQNHHSTNALGALLGMLVLYLVGTLWLALQLDLSLKAALFMGVIPYLPTDIIKIVLALFLGAQIRKHLTRAGLI